MPVPRSTLELPNRNGQLGSPWQSLRSGNVFLRNGVYRLRKVQRLQPSSLEFGVPWQIQSASLFCLHIGDIET